MSLTQSNEILIAFKRLSGKAHTQQTFGYSEESISSNISLSYSTVFGQPINPNPVSVGGLNTFYANDGKVEKIRFDVEIIPGTLIGTNQSQGYRLKLPASYTASGKLGSHFSGGTRLHTALGKLQIVPSLYGKLKTDGSTEYDPILYQGDGTTVITKFDPINWLLDNYSGIIFVQNPPAGYDVSAAKPTFMDAFLYCGQYMDQVIASGITGGSVSWGNILSKPTLFPPLLPIPFTGVTGLQTALNNYIPLSQKGAPNGVPPLNASSVIPPIYIPAFFKEVYVVPNVAARTAKFVPSGSTPGAGQVESFPGLRVFLIDSTGAPELPSGTTGSSETVDTTGFLLWSGITSAQIIVPDWNTITGKPASFVYSITPGAGINVLPPAGTGFTTVSIKTDGAYVDTLVPSGKLTIKDLSIDPRKLKFQAGATGTTGQFIVRGTGDTFQAITVVFNTVTGVTAASGVTNIGTSTHPFLVAQVDGSDNTIQTSINGLKVRNSSIGTNKLNIGSAALQINAYSIPLNTGSTYTQATDVGHAIEKLATGITALNTVALTGATNVGSGTTHLVRSASGHTVQIKTLKHGKNIAISEVNSTITIAVSGLSGVTASTGTIGVPTDGTYTDGLLPFTASTKISDAVDALNTVLKGLAPTPAPNLSQATGAGTFASAKLSFGVTKPIAGFVNVGTNAGNPAVDINGDYVLGGTRLGVTNTLIAGTLNTSVVGGGGGIPYNNTAFADGDKGKLVIYKNGLKFTQLMLSGTTASTSNTYISVSAVQQVKFPSGQPLSIFTYRTGIFNIPVSAMTNGYNYIRVVHSGATFSRQTNFLEWVYDNDASVITLGGLTGLTNVSLGGTKFLSGVKYHTGGTVQYQGTFSNVYKNVYSDIATAIDFPTRDNLGAMTVMDVNGSALISRSASPLQTLPNLDTSLTNPQNTTMTILGTLPINVSTVLGNVGVTGRLRSNVSVANPFATQSFLGGVSTMTGFLINNITQSSILNNETLDGEVLRLQARDYSLLTYANVNAGTYAWDSTQSLIGANAQHNTGLLVFNGELLYPNAAFLTTQYGITTGNFNAVTHTPAGNVNYTSAAGIRDYYREFKSANGTTQSTLTFTITHTGVASDFLTNGGTGGVPAGNNIKFEFLIMRADTTIYGWANPFASTGNPFGIANTSTSQVGSTMTVSCTLSTTPRVASGDIVVVRIFAASGYTNRIQNLAITNI
jgi:hypothetical protein